MLHLNNLSMGGYGAYVWSTYAITVLVLGMNLYTTLREKQRTAQKVKHYLMRCTHES